jgi:hypothetical protein
MWIFAMVTYLCPGEAINMRVKASDPITNLDGTKINVVIL